MGDTPQYNPAGLGVELEMGLQRFTNDTIQSWVDGDDETMKAKAKGGEKKIKGVPLIVSKKPTEGEPAVAIPGATADDWELTAETSGGNSQHYVQIKGEYIVDGRKVHVSNDEAVVRRIGEEIAQHYRSWGEGTPPVINKDLLEVSIKPPTTPIENWFFEDAGVWRVTTTPTYQSANLGIHVTTAMPLEMLLEGNVPPALKPIKFQFIIEDRGEWIDYVCTTEKLRSGGVLGKSDTPRNNVFDWKVPADFRAFITLCSVYASRGPSALPANGPKEACYLVPRNTFTALFNLVNGPKVMSNFADGWKNSITRLVATNLDTDVATLRTKTLKWAKEGNGVNELSVGEWLDKLYDGIDLLTEKDSKENWGDGSIGRLQDTFEYVGSGINSRPCPIWEFRALGGTTFEGLADKLAQLNNAFFILGSGSDVIS